MDADAVWSKKSAALRKQALKRPTNTAIDLMLNKSLERICKLNPAVQAPSPEEYKEASVIGRTRCEAKMIRVDAKDGQYKVLLHEMFT